MKGWDVCMHPSKLKRMHGEVTRDGNGKRIISLCETFELKMANRQSILENSPFQPRDAKVKTGAECGTDHFWVKARISIL